MVLYYAIQIRKSSGELPENNIFSPGDLDLWPMTLIIKLDLDMVQIDRHVKFCVHTSKGSAMRVLNHRHTTYTTHTDGTDSITSTANAGDKYTPVPITGKNQSNAICKRKGDARWTFWTSYLKFIQEQFYDFWSWNKTTDSYTSHCSISRSKHTGLW